MGPAKSYQQKGSLFHRVMHILWNSASQLFDNKDVAEKRRRRFRLAQKLRHEGQGPKILMVIGKILSSEFLMENVDESTCQQVIHKNASLLGLCRPKTPCRRDSMVIPRARRDIPALQGKPSHRANTIYQSGKKRASAKFAHLAASVPRLTKLAQREEIIYNGHCPESHSFLFRKKGST